MKIVLLVLIGCTCHVTAFSKDELNKIKSIVDKELKDQTQELLNQIQNQEKQKQADEKTKFLFEKLNNKFKNDMKKAANTKREIEAKRFPFKDVNILAERNNKNKNEQRSVNNCFDIYGEEKCQALHFDLGMDCDEDRLSDMCEKTCGKCPVTEDCRETKYGCCIDGKTKKMDPKGLFCPVCKDSSKDLCENHESDCNEIGFVGEWMRSNCLETCGVCAFDRLCKLSKFGCCRDGKTIKTDADGTICQSPKELCRDREKACGEWKEAQLCEPFKDMMMKDCRKTCGYCQDNHIPNEHQVVMHER